MPAPFEIVAGLVDAWLAPIGTAFPAINAAPGGGWVKLGAGGAKDYEESAGLIVRHEVNVQRIRSLGTTGPRKAFRDSEDLLIELTLMDSTAESVSAVLNQLAITTLAGPPAEKTVQLLEGPVVTTRALLVRGLLSPYADSANNLQFDIPIVFQNGPMELAFLKGKPVSPKVQFVALVDDALGFGKLHLPTA